MIKKNLVNNNLQKIKSIIAVAGGKGGVGKSTTCALLASELRNKNYSVGLFDGDILGASIALMSSKKPPQLTVTPSNHILPFIVDGIKVMSYGFLNNISDYIKNLTVFRGPMVAKISMDMLLNTRWGKLDFLIIDLPPGSGDVPLSLVQNIKNLYGLIVSTAQKLALQEAANTILLFNELSIKTVGYIENMSFFIPPNQTANQQKKSYNLFTGNETLDLYEEYGVPLLAKVPLDPICSELSNNSIILNRSNCDKWLLSPTYLEFQKISKKVIANIQSINDNHKEALGNFSLIWR